MKIQVCTGKACSDNFSEYITKRLESDKEFYNLDNVIIENCMCTGNCKEGPTLYVDKELYKRVNPAIASKMVLEKIKGTFKKRQKKKHNTKTNKKK